MYIDLIVIVILLLIVVFFFRRFSNFVYGFGLIDIFFRLAHFLGSHLPLPDLSNLINKYLPYSIEAVINKYASGIINDILMWGYFIIFCIFWFYIARIFIKRKK